MKHFERYCLIVSSLIMILSIGVYSGCSGIDEVCSTCRCFNSTSTVDCSGVGLHEIPKMLPVNLTSLDLSGNNISAIDADAFQGCFHLELIHLEGNSISSFPEMLFADLGGSLAALYAHDINLRLENESSVFQPLRRSLKSLYIHNNVVVNCKVFRGLRSLEIFHLDGDISGGFCASLASLMSLREVKIYAPLHQLKNETFKHLAASRNLTKLDIRDVGVRSMETGCFQPLRSLLSLNLGYNTQLTLDNVSSTLDGLPSRLEELILTGLIGNYRPTLSLSTDIIDKLQAKSLKRLKLNKNGLIYIPNSFSRALNGLEYLDISFNRYSNTFSLVCLGFLMVNVSHLIANMQSIWPKFSSPDEFNPRTDEIERVSRARTATAFRTRAKSKYSKNSCHAAELAACTFPMYEVPSDTSWCVPAFRSLKILEFAGAVNERILELPPTLVLGNSRVEEVYFGRNFLEMLKGPMIVDRPVNVKPLLIDASYNMLYCLAPDFLNISISRGLIIGQFNLEGNDLSAQLREDIKGDTFASYPNMTKLNLANNKIKFLHFNSFRNLFNLEILNLSSNSLQLLEFNILSMTKLRHLDLASNLFVMFQTEMITNLNSMATTNGSSGLSLRIRGNPFQCSCEAYGFVSWMAGNRSKIDDLNEVMCMYKNSLFPMSSAGDITTAMFLDCQSLVLAIVGGLLALLTVCTFLGVVLYKYRWDIRYYLLRHHQLKKKYLLLSEQEINYMYDAFVSYDMKDRKWIVQELIVNVEGDRRSISKSNNPSVYGSMESCSAGDRSFQGDGEVAARRITEESEKRRCFKLCIHERDFEPGKLIESNILEAIQKSRMVILVVTKHFVTSNWCRLELEMAKMESLERGRNVVIIIFLEPLEETLESLEWLMKRYTYMEWFKCDTARKKEMFWKILRVTLGSLKVEKKDIII